jgi:hypothetical protein
MGRLRIMALESFWKHATHSLKQKFCHATAAERMNRFNISHFDQQPFNHLHQP